MSKNRRRRSARLEMTSLMDVMFLVLVFFIYCVFDMTVHKGLKVDLPNAKGADERGERIVLTIAADDSLQLNGASVTRTEAIDKVKGLYATDVKLPVIISGDCKSSLGTGIELLAELKASGVEKVSFQVRGEKTSGEK